MRPKMFKRRRKQREKKFTEMTIFDMDLINKRYGEVMQKINDLFDDVDIKDKHIFKEENKNGNSGKHDSNSKEQYRGA